MNYPFYSVVLFVFLFYFENVIIIYNKFKE